MRNNDIKLIAFLCSLIVLLIVVTFLAFNMYQPDISIESGYIPGQTVITDENKEQTTQSEVITESTTVNGQTVVTTSVPAQQNSETQAVLSSQTQISPVTSSVDVSSMTDQELLDMLTAAINKTKAYTGNVSVDYVESFEVNVIECTGGSIVRSVANTIVDMVVKPVDEVLSFSGGTATISDGETIPILLPQKGNFALKTSGVKEISGSKDGNNTVIKVKIIQEQVDLYTVPTANSSAIGYLDINSYDTSALEITSAKIDYVGSTMEVHIRPDGYVSYAKYEMPMNVEGAAKGGSISGSAVFDGQQTEIWKFNW